MKTSTIWLHENYIPATAGALIQPKNGDRFADMEGAGI